MIVDVYDPLDIDESWDDVDMAPVGAAGPNMGGDASSLGSESTSSATAVAVKSEDDVSKDQSETTTSSTLPPDAEDVTAESSVMPGAEVKTADFSNDGTAESAMGGDAAYDAAELAIGEDVKSMPGAESASTDTDELNFKDMTSTPVVESPDAALATAEVATEEAKEPAEKPTLKIDVQKADDEAPAESATAGATFTPEIEPEGGIREDMQPEAQEEPAEQPKPDLPVSPTDHEAEGHKDKKVDTEPEAKGKDGQEYLQLLIDAKEEALKGISQDITTAEKDVASLASQIKALETTRDEAQARLDALNSKKAKIESSVK